MIIGMDKEREEVEIFGRASRIVRSPPIRARALSSPDRIQPDRVGEAGLERKKTLNYAYNYDIDKEESQPGKRVKTSLSAMIKGKEDPS